MDKSLYVKQLGIFAKISFFEGVSFIVLLFIAMPLKYLMDMPLAVKYIGWAHGALFVAYAFQLLYVGVTFKWKFTKVILYGFCSILPFAPFWVEKQLKIKIQTV
ncbi:MAG: integral membrane protein [Vicingaceae bacterium]|jgi:integral membrane protein